MNDFDATSIWNPDEQFSDKYVRPKVRCSRCVRLEAQVRLLESSQDKSLIAPGVMGRGQEDAETEAPDDK